MKGLNHIIILRLLLVYVVIDGVTGMSLLNGNHGESCKTGMCPKRSNSENGQFQQAVYPRDCAGVNARHKCTSSDLCSGVYLIKPDGIEEAFEVHCNNTIDNGGWTVFQRRLDGSIDFNRNWNEYKHGFGFLGREFWLGNEKLSYLTNQGDYQLRIDVVNSLGDSYYALYDLFRVSDEKSSYKIVSIGEYSGTTENGMLYHLNREFSTYDHYTADTKKCKLFKSGWWYGHPHCYNINLNTPYFGDGYGSISWNQLPGDIHNIIYTEMKIRSI